MASKRPLSPDVSTEQNGRERKRKKINDARKINTKPTLGNVVPPALKPLPTSLDVVKFTEARAFEIAAMQTSMKTVRRAASSRVWQSLPRHLRRRAASHNVRRVPQRLRDKARQEMDPVKKKKLQRLIAKIGKTKRQTRSENLRRRQRDKRWLETHLWHAKRMKMIDIWGYRLAIHPTEKSFRPSHRAAVHGSILHDSSYTAIIEIKAQLEILKRILGRVCGAQGISASALRYSNGSRMCSTEMYDDAAYPFRFIAPVRILWRPDSEKDPGPPKEKDFRDLDPKLGDVHTIWLFIHPATYERASAALTSATISIMNIEYRLGMHEFEKDKDTGKCRAQVEIADLRGHFNVFDIMGPKSSQVIHGAFTLEKNESENGPVQKQLWNGLKELRTPASCPRGLVAGLQAYDPRLNFPPKNARISELKTEEKPGLIVPPCPALATCKIWSETVRLGLSRPQYKKRDLDERRSKNLIPGTPLAPLKQDDRIPFLLVQQSLEAPLSTTSDVKSSDNTALHGWTIIAPLGWGMPFLSSLVYTGTRVGGLREVKSQTIESGLPYFPDDFSGTAPGREAQSQKGSESRDKWERTPPAKRPAYEILGTRSPFEPDWEVVCGMQKPSALSDGLEDTQRMEEDPTELWLLYGQNTRDIVAELISSQDPVGTLVESLNAARESRGLPKLEQISHVVYRGALALVRLSMCGRGVPTDMSIIYDISEKERAAWSKKSMGNSDEAFQFLTEENQIIGYVTSGRMSLARGKGLGIGAIALAKLVDSMKRHKNTQSLSPHLVKIRESHGEVYRPALVEVI
ncbi:POP1-domain-containing protein [Serendipita vermifera]|nr:POP1-domain-containing protein [Serendipita vermifera]